MRLANRWDHCYMLISRSQTHTKHAKTKRETRKCYKSHDNEWNELLTFCLEVRVVVVTERMKLPETQLDFTAMTDQWDNCRGNQDYTDAPRTRACAQRRRPGNHGKYQAANF